MNTKIIKFDINKNLYDTLIAKQGDTKSRFLLFNLLDGSIPFSLENRSVRVYAIKPDGTEIFNDLIITDAAKGYCILELTTQMLAVAGIVKLELMVIEDEKKLTSNIFYMDVKKSINSEKAVVSTNEFGALLTALASLDEYDNYKNEIKNARGGQVNLKTRLDNFGEQLDNIKNKQNDVLINVRDFGVLGNGTDETEKIQLAFDSIEKGQTLYFPIGDYRTRGIIFKNSSGYDIVKIKGANSQQFSEDDLEDNLRGNCTSITYIGENNGFLFNKLSSCTNNRRVIIEDILFKGSETINDVRYQQNTFIYHGRNESVNGAYPNVYATNCKFWGFKTVVGEYQAYDNGQDGDSRTDIEQTNIYATKCQFTRNKHALSNIIDSYINKCVFNLNDVAIILRKWGFANRIIDNRIEWNREYGIYLYQGESLIENNEFDRTGYAGLYMKKSKSSIVIGNKFLRNGAYENENGNGSKPDLIDGLENVHVVFSENEDCIFKGNVTREERQWDNGNGDVVPNRCGVFKDNTNCIIRDNTLTGGFIKYSNPSVLNIFENNKYCLIDNIMYKNNQVTHKNYNHNFVLNANSTKYLSFDFINKVDKDSPSQIHKLTVTCFISNYMDYTNTKAHEVSYILFYKGENDNQGYIQGEITKKLGNDNTIPFEIVNFDYFRESNSIGINFKNNTQTNNNYFISFE